MGPSRYVFPVFVVAMWAVCGLGISNGQWTPAHWLMLAIGHIACTITFVRFAWVFSYGYALAMMLVNLAVVVWFPGGAAFLVGGLGIAYGARLIAFVDRRRRSASYASFRRNVHFGDGRRPPLPVHLFMWVACGWLMSFAVMPTWLAAQSAGITPGVACGALLMAIGLVLESIADEQKQAAKAVAAGAFVRSGLYARSRHPNYLGEIVFQLGLVLVAVSVAQNGWQLALGTLAPAYISLLMVFAARGQDADQAQRYGSDAAYRDWRAASGLLLPRLRVPSPRPETTDAR